MYTTKANRSLRNNRFDTVAAPFLQQPGLPFAEVLTAEAIERATGRKVPEGYKISVIEADPDYDQTFVIPAMTARELSDDDLEQVAGGSGCADKGCSGYTNVCGIVI